MGVGSWELGERRDSILLATLTRILAIALFPDLG
jgi:hypothetical protein